MKLIAAPHRHGTGMVRILGTPGFTLAIQRNRSPWLVFPVVRDSNLGADVIRHAFPIINDFGHPYPEKRRFTARISNSQWSRRGFGGKMARISGSQWFSRGEVVDDWKYVPRIAVSSDGGTRIRGLPGIRAVDRDFFGWRHPESRTTGNTCRETAMRWMPIPEFVDHWRCAPRYFTATALPQFFLVKILR